MNNKGNKWVVPVIVIAVVGSIIFGSIFAIRFVKKKAEETLTMAAEDLYEGLTGEAFDLDEFAAEHDTEDYTDDYSEDDTEDSVQVTSGYDADDISRIYGGWESVSYYEFREDGTYGWYKSSEDLDDNYYSGTVSVLKGYDACEHLGITFDKVLTVIENSEGTVGLDDIYCITCYPTYLVSGGIDKSDTLGGGYYDLLFVITGEDSAQGLNMGNYDTYYFTKIK